MLPVAGLQAVDRQIDECVSEKSVSMYTLSGQSVPTCL